MNLNLLKVLFILIALGTSSCEKEHLFDCFKSTGKIIKEERDVTGFSGINVSDNVDVFISQGTTYSVTVEAGEHIIEGITTNIESNTLYIHNENKCNWVRKYDNPLAVYLTVPSLVSVFHQGNGDIVSDEKLEIDNLIIEVWGSGNVNLMVDGKFVKSLQHVSVGDVQLSGIVEDLYVYNNGNAFSYMTDLKAKKVQVDHRGTGECIITADSILNYYISGMGNVYLYGNPIINGNSTGEGMLIRK